MRVKLLGSSIEDTREKQYLTTLVINDCVAIDAGSLGFSGDLEAQSQVRHVVFSHTHMDHVASLPMFLENVYEPHPECVTLHGSKDFLDALEKHIFNGRIWPDFLTLGGEDAPFCETSQIEAEEPIEIEGLTITPVEVNHGVPTFGFIIDSGESAIVVASDTAQTDRLWELANGTDRLKAVFLDASFPNELEWLAGVSYHLTPRGFAQEVTKLTRDVPIFAVHVKPRYRDQVIHELEEESIARLKITVPGKEYRL